MPNINNTAPHPPSSSEEPLLMDDLVMNPPNWLLKSGVSIMAFAVGLALILSWIIKYPDKINASFMLTSENPPIEIVSHISAEIDTFLVKDQQEVTAGQLLLTLKSTADWQHIKQLSGWLEKMELIPDLQTLVALDIPSGLRIGELQAPYEILQHSIYGARQFLAEDLTQQKLSAVESEIKQIAQLNRSLARQESIFQQELDLDEKDHDRSTQLNQDKSISDRDLEISQGELLQKYRELESMRSGIIQNEIRKRQLQGRLIELQHELRQNLNTYYHTLQQNISTLKEAVRTWLEDHLVHSPRSGHITFVEGLSSGRFIEATRPIASVLPLSGKGKITGRAYVPLQGVGAIKLGDEINIRLDAYPEQEYGMLRGQIDKISPLPAKTDEGKHFYLMETYLPDVLSTTHGEVIPFMQQLVGNATIITREKRLLERLFEKLTGILKSA